MFRLLKLLFGRPYLYFPGCLTENALPEIKKNYEKILDFLKVPWIESNLNCCGSPILNAGYRDDFEQLKERNLENLKKLKVEAVLTNCPACWLTFKELYEFPARLILELVHENLDCLPGGVTEGVWTFHDPCHLGRKGGVYDSPREILEHLGITLVEMEHSREFSLCCGGGGGLRGNFPEISKKIALLRVEEAKSAGAEAIVTACPMCYLVLKETGFPVYEISEVIVRAIDKGSESS